MWKKIINSLGLMTRKQVEEQVREARKTAPPHDVVVALVRKARPYGLHISGDDTDGRLQEHLRSLGKDLGAVDEHQFAHDIVMNIEVNRDPA